MDPMAGHQWFLVVMGFMLIENGSAQYYTDAKEKVNVGVCYPKHRCLPSDSENRCGQAPTNMDDCGCDFACTYYQDCCYDYASVCMTPTETDQPTADADLLQCISVYPGDSSEGFFVIGMCKEDSSVDHDIINKCKIAEDDDVLLTVIVSDVDNNIYKNVYCALCNGLSLVEVKAWEANFKCIEEEVEVPDIRSSSGSSLGLSYTESEEKTNSSDARKQVADLDPCRSVTFKPPLYQNDTRRKCNTEAKSTCSTGYSNECVVDDCLRYKETVYSSSYTYKNPYCALCNHDTYECKKKIINLICNCEPGFQGVPEFPFKFTDLTIIVDFSTDSGISVSSQHGSYTTKDVICTNGKVLDPSTSKCLQITCEPGLILEHSTCIAPSTLSGCDGVVAIPPAAFCLCGLHEQLINVEYEYIIFNDKEDFPPVDELRDYLNYMGLRYEIKNTPDHKANISFTTFKIEADCQLAYNISNLVISGIDFDIDTLDRVSIQQNCSVNEIPSELHCYFNRSILTRQSFDINSTTRSISYGDSVISVPDDGYLLEVEYQIVNKSYTCSSLSISTCEPCPRISLDLSSFDQTNETLVHSATGKIFTEDVYIFTNASNTSVFVCSFFNQTGSSIVFSQLFNYSGIQLILSVAGTIISLVCLFITVLLRLIFSELRTLSGKMVMNISFTLFCALLLTMLQANFLVWRTVCKIVAVSMHYLWLVCFMWMNAMAIELFKTFRFFRPSPRSKKTQKNVFIWYSLYSWGIPAIYIGTLLLNLEYFDFGGLNLMYGDDTVCWIRDEVASLYVFGIPLAVILLPNLILFVATITGIWEARKATAVVSGSKSKQKKLTEEMIIYIRISTVMGLSWVFGFLVAFGDHVIFIYVFIILNTLQGFFIFIAFNMTHSIKKIVMSRKKKETTSTANTSLSTISRRSDNRA